LRHQKHLKAHKPSCRWGTLGGTFVAATEILEDLAKIKWGKAVGPPFLLSTEGFNCSMQSEPVRQKK
jgi:hypothetical protein